jgi:streptogramin lyase
MFCIALVACAGVAADGGDLKVRVESSGAPVATAAVEVWQAIPGKPPRKLASATTDSQGGTWFRGVRRSDEGVVYLIARGGQTRGRDADQYSAVAVLGRSDDGEVIRNERTTIGSVWPNAQLLTAEAGLQGTSNGLLIGSEHVRNLVDVSTGRFGSTILNGANLPDSETVARMNTLAALMALCGARVDDGYCDEFLATNGAKDTLDALRRIAVQPYRNQQVLFDLFSKAYPYPEGAGRRSTNFLPYLSYVPEDFALMVRFTGGGIYSPGRLMFDNRGQLWSGQNWMPGSQSGLSTSIGGGVVRMAAGGETLSPAPEGLNGQGLDGIGWGTTVSEDKVWVSSFNGVVGVFDLDGNVLGPAIVSGGNGALQGLATAPNGDVWICDNQNNQMLRFPGGDHRRGEIVSVPDLKRPFAVAVGNDNSVWVTNNGFVTMTRFPGDDPQAAEQIRLNGMGPRGLAIDSTGHVWVANNFSMGYPVAKVPEGASIIEEFRLNILKVLENEKAGIDKSGNMALVAPSGEVIASGLLAGVVYAPWGVSIDGNDNVFVGNFLGTGFVHICGTNTAHCPSGMKTGDLIHRYESGVLQESTDTMVDDAGNVWMANNWNVIPALVDEDPDRRTATMGGGDGIVVIYGLARPVVNPLIGQVRTAKVSASTAESPSDASERESPAGRSRGRSASAARIGEVLPRILDQPR